MDDSRHGSWGAASLVGQHSSGILVLGGGRELRIGGRFRGGDGFLGGIAHRNGANNGVVVGMIDVEAAWVL
jgi:hypothetical protein